MNTTTDKSPEKINASSLGTLSILDGITTFKFDCLKVCNLLSDKFDIYRAITKKKVIFIRKHKNVIGNELLIDEVCEVMNNYLRENIFVEIVLGPDEAPKLLNLTNTLQTEWANSWQLVSNAKFYSFLKIIQADSSRDEFFVKMHKLQFRVGEAFIRYYGPDQLARLAYLSQIGRGVYLWNEFARARLNGLLDEPDTYYKTFCRLINAAMRLYGVEVMATKRKHQKEADSGKPWTSRSLFRIRPYTNILVVAEYEKLAKMPYPRLLLKEYEKSVGVGSPNPSVEAEFLTGKNDLSGENGPL
jgi:hypothetical protein